MRSLTAMRVIASARRSRSVVAQAIGAAARLPPLDLLSPQAQNRDKDT